MCSLVLTWRPEAQALSRPWGPSMGVSPGGGAEMRRWSQSRRSLRPSADSLGSVMAAPTYGTWKGIIANAHIGEVVLVREVQEGGSSNKNGSWSSGGSDTWMG